MRNEHLAVLNRVLTLAACFLMGWFVRGADWECASVAAVAFLLSLTLPEDE
jgi:hypothetical protein